MKPLRDPETLLEAVRQFADPIAAHDYFVSKRWPNGVACPRMGCGSADVTYLGPKYLRWNCKDCKRQFTAKVGTIFEDSPIGFDKWLPAIWLIASNRNGISSCELARGLQITQKSAWFMLHRIRAMMAYGAVTELTGIVEADETWIGGKRENLPKAKRRTTTAEGRGSSYDSKTGVFGMVERKGRVRAFVMASKKGTSEELRPIMRESIHHSATVYTDAATHYVHLDEDFLYHESVNHSLDEYVRGAVHTNTIENFWSVLKRMLAGTYIAVRPKHLGAYLDEEIFRYNERENTDGPRFVTVVRNADGRRLTYKALIAD